MQQTIRYLCCVGLGIALGLSLTLSGQEHTKQYQPALNYPILLDVIDTIENYYVDKITEEELIDAAIEGIFNKLDPYSKFLNQNEFASLQETNKGEYFGYGIEIDTEDNKITIVTPFPDSPAAIAGIKAGDQITKLNDKTITAENQEAILKEIQAASLAQQTIKLQLSRASNQEPIDVTLTPMVISINSVSAKMLEHQLGYIQLSSFQDNSAADIVTQLIEWQSAPLNGLILDLRNNPGGLLEQAIKIADMFLEKGRIVATEGRFFDANSDYYASPRSILRNTPIIVLINKNSASAAEVLAAALQENGRAKLIGQTSFGKGTVQSIIPTLMKGGAIKLTIAKYTTPQGHDIHSKGIVPDIEIALENTNNETEIASNNLSINNEDIEQDKLINSAITWMKTNN